MKHPTDTPEAASADARRRLAAIPVRTEAAPEAASEAAAGGDCSAAEPFALRVVGTAMAPEFDDGDIIVVEPEGLAGDGSYVVAFWQDEWTFRQLRRVGAGWSLAALDPALPAQPIPDLTPVRGVVIQKSKPGRRRASKRYVD